MYKCISNDGSNKINNIRFAQAVLRCITKWTFRPLEIQIGRLCDMSDHQTTKSNVHGTSPSEIQRKARNDKASISNCSKDVPIYSRIALVNGISISMDNIQVKRSIKVKKYYYNVCCDFELLCGNFCLK